MAGNIQRRNPRKNNTYRYHRRNVGKLSRKLFRRGNRGTVANHMERVGRK